MTLLPIILKSGFIPKVKVGDRVTKSSKIAEKKNLSSDEKINLSTLFKISPKDLKKYLKKNLGDFAEKGEVIAVKSGSFGFSSNEILSPFSGTIAKIDEETGEITIKTGLAENEEELFSPVEGKIEICNNEKIVIKTDLDAIIAEDAVGEEAEGSILYLKDNIEGLLNSGIKDKVLVTKTIEKALIFKAISLDAAGIIAEDLEDTDFLDLADKKISIPIMVLSDSNFKKIEKYLAGKVYLNGKDKSLVFYE